jgi:restriction system protein
MRCWPVEVERAQIKRENYEPTAWKDYQEKVASFFRSLGLDTSTDVTVRGVRTTHDIDVLVKSHHVGFEITWLVECKYWNSRVSKLHVLALREIVADIGADRGILLSESGFQSGAIEAANLTNVQVTSLAAVSATARDAISSMRLRELFDRIENCDNRYWEIPKEDRIKHGLRFEPGGGGDYDMYSGARVVGVCRELLSRGFRGVYPIDSKVLPTILTPKLPEKFESPEDIIAVVQPMVSELEEKLDAYEAAPSKNLTK